MWATILRKKARRSLFLLVLLVAILVSQTPFSFAGQQAPAALSNYGVIFQVKSTWGDNGRAVLTEMRSDGPFWLRSSWFEYDRPTTGERQHTTILEVKAFLAANDIEPLWLIGQPSFGYSDWSPLRNYKLDDWRRLVRDTMTEISGASAVEIINEPNWKNTWISNSMWDFSNKTNYLQLLKVAHDEIKAVSPQTTIVAGSLATLAYPAEIDDWKTWLDFVVQNGGLAYMDAFSFHFYRDWKTDQEAINDINYIRGKVGNLPLWVTEIGYRTTDEKLQSDYASHILDPGKGVLSWGVSKVFWYQVYDKSDSYGLLRLDWTYKPTYYSFATWLRDPTLTIKRR
jgi:hypothetical protein